MIKPRNSKNNNIGGKGEILFFASMRKKAWLKLTSAIIALVFLFNVTCPPVYAYRPGNYGNKSAADAFLGGLLVGGITSFFCLVSPTSSPAMAVSTVASDISSTYMYYHDYKNHNKPLFTIEFRLFGFWGPKIKMTFTKGEVYAMGAGILAGAAAGAVQGAIEEALKDTGKEFAKETTKTTLETTLQTSTAATTQAATNAVVATITASFFATIKAALATAAKWVWNNLIVASVKNLIDLVVSPIRTVINIIRGIGRLARSLYDKVFSGKELAEEAGKAGGKLAEQVGKKMANAAKATSSKSNFFQKLGKKLGIGSNPSPYRIYGAMGLKGIHLIFYQMVADFARQLLKAAIRETVLEKFKDMGLDEEVAEIAADTFMYTVGDRYVDGVVLTAFATPFGLTVTNNGGFATKAQMKDANARDALGNEKLEGVVDENGNELTVAEATSAKVIVTEDGKILDPQAVKQLKLVDGKLKAVVVDENGQTKLVDLKTANLQDVLDSGKEGSILALVVGEGDDARIAIVNSSEVRNKMASKVQEFVSLIKKPTNVYAWKDVHGNNISDNSAIAAGFKAVQNQGLGSVIGGAIKIVLLQNVFKYTKFKTENAAKIVKRAMAEAIGNIVAAGIDNIDALGWEYAGRPEEGNPYRTGRGDKYSERMKNVIGHEAGVLIDRYMWAKISDRLGLEGASGELVHLALSSLVATASDAITRRDPGIAEQVLYKRVVDGQKLDAGDIKEKHKDDLSTIVTDEEGNTYQVFFKSEAEVDPNSIFLEQDGEIISFEEFQAENPGEYRVEFDEETNKRLVVGEDERGKSRRIPIAEGDFLVQNAVVQEDGSEKLVRQVLTIEQIQENSGSNYFEIVPKEVDGKYSYVMRGEDKEGNPQEFIILNPTFAAQLTKTDKKGAPHSIDNSEAMTLSLEDIASASNPQDKMYLFLEGGADKPYLAVIPHNKKQGVQTYRLNENKVTGVYQLVDVEVDTGKEYILKQVVDAKGAPVYEHKYNQRLTDADIQKSFGDNMRTEIDPQTGNKLLIGEDSDGNTVTLLVSKASDPYLNGRLSLDTESGRRFLKTWIENLNNDTAMAFWSSHPTEPLNVPPYARLNVNIAAHQAKQDAMINVIKARAKGAWPIQAEEGIAASALGQQANRRLAGSLGAAINIHMPGLKVPQNQRSYVSFIPSDERLAYEIKRLKGEKDQITRTIEEMAEEPAEFVEQKIKVDDEGVPHVVDGKEMTLSEIREAYGDSYYVVFDENVKEYFLVGEDEEGDLPTFRIKEPVFVAQRTKENDQGTPLTDDSEATILDLDKIRNISQGPMRLVFDGDANKPYLITSDKQGQRQTYRLEDNRMNRLNQLVEAREGILSSISTDTDIAVIQYRLAKLETAQSQFKGIEEKLNERLKTTTDDTEIPVVNKDLLYVKKRIEEINNEMLDLEGVLNEAGQDKVTVAPEVVEQLTQLDEMIYAQATQLPQQVISEIVKTSGRPLGTTKEEAVHTIGNNIDNAVDSLNIQAAMKQAEIEYISSDASGYSGYGLKYVPFVGSLASAISTARDGYTDPTEFVTGGSVEYTADRRIEYALPMSDYTKKVAKAFVESNPDKVGSEEFVETAKKNLEEGQNYRITSIYNPSIAGVAKTSETYGNSNLGVDVRGSLGALSQELDEYFRAGMLIRDTEDITNDKVKRYVEFKLAHPTDEEGLRQLAKELDAEQIKTAEAFIDGVEAIKQLRKERPNSHLEMITFLPGESQEKKQNVEIAIQEILREGRRVFSNKYALTSRTTRDQWGVPLETTYYDQTYDSKTRQWNQVKLDKTTDYYRNSFGIALVENEDYTDVGLPKKWPSEEREIIVEPERTEFDIVEPEHTETKVVTPARKESYVIKPERTEVVERRVPRLPEFTSTARDQIGASSRRKVAEFRTEEEKQEILASLGYDPQRRVLVNDEGIMIGEVDIRGNAIYVNDKAPRVTRDSTGATEHFAGGVEISHPYDSPFEIVKEERVIPAVMGERIIPAVTEEVVVHARTEPRIVEAKRKTLTTTDAYSVGPNITQDINVYTTGEGHSPWAGPSNRVIIRNIQSGPGRSQAANYALAPRIVYSQYEGAITTLTEMKLTGEDNAEKWERQLKILEDLGIDVDDVLERLKKATPQVFEKSLEIQELKDTASLIIQEKRDQIVDLSDVNDKVNVLLADRRIQDKINQFVQTYGEESKDTIREVFVKMVEDSELQTYSGEHKTISLEDIKKDPEGYRQYIEEFAKEVVMTPEIAATLAFRHEQTQAQLARDMASIQDMQFYKYEQIPNGKTYAFPTWSLKAGYEHDGSSRFDRVQAFTYDKDTTLSMLDAAYTRAGEQGNKPYQESIEDIGVYNIAGTDKHLITENLIDTNLDAIYTYKTKLNAPLASEIKPPEDLGDIPVIPLVDVVDGYAKVTPIDTGIGMQSISPQPADLSLAPQVDTQINQVQIEQPNAKPSAVPEDNRSNIGESQFTPQQEEIEIKREAKRFKELTEQEKEIFTGVDLGPDDLVIVPPIEVTAEKPESSESISTPAGEVEAKTKAEEALSTTATQMRMVIVSTALDNFQLSLDNKKIDVKESIEARE